MAAWIESNRGRDDAYLLRLRPGRVTMLAKTKGRMAVMDDAFTVTDVEGIAARLTFAWAHRGTFVDGLSLVQGELAAVAEVRVAASEPLRLCALRGDHAGLVLEPTPTITLGRAPDNDLVLAHRLVSKRQSVLTVRDGGWHVRDAGSTSGTFVEQTQVREETPLHFGDRLDLGGLALLVV